jgi:hypothetical protein
VCLFLDFASLVNSPHNPSASIFSVSQFILGDDKSIWGKRYWIASSCRSHLVKLSIKTEKNRGMRKLFHLLYKRGNLQHNVQYMKRSNPQGAMISYTVLASFFISTIWIVLLFWLSRLRITTLFDTAPNQTYNTFC